MPKKGATGDGKSAVATPDGKKPKEEEGEEDVVRCFLPHLIIQIGFPNIGGMASFVISCFGCD